jgi:HAD superfamily hydrolase (TIGR01490 family)
VAAFDFDGTITQRDTLAGFLVFVGGRGAVARASARRSLSMAAGLRNDIRRDQAKEAVLGDVLGGRSDDDLRAAGERYAALLPERYRPDIVQRVGWHRHEGHELVIVSASLAYYLGPVASALGIDHVIGVEMAVGPDGLLTGVLAGPNVRGAEKATRLQAWWADRPADELWAYGNSSGDEALLSLADHPTWVGRRAR